MRLPLDQFGKIKNFIHVAQAVILFLAWVLTIAIFTRDGTTDGRVGWYFGLVRAVRLLMLTSANASIPVLAHNPHPDLLSYGAHVVPREAVLERLCLCLSRRPVRDPVAQRLGSRCLVRVRWKGQR